MGKLKELLCERVIRLMGVLLRDTEFEIQLIVYSIDDCSLRKFHLLSYLIPYSIRKETVICNLWSLSSSKYIFVVITYSNYSACHHES